MRRVRRLTFGLLVIAILAAALGNTSTPSARPEQSRPDAASGVALPPTVPKTNRGPDGKGELEPIRRIGTPSDAMRLAAADLSTLGPFDRIFARYVWIPEANPGAIKVVSAACNYVSRSSVIRRPDPVGDGVLMRIDLRWYAPRTSDQNEWLKFWEELAYDPAFNLLITRDIVKFAEGEIPKTQIRRETSRVVVGEQKWRVEKRDIRHAGGRYVWPDDSGRSRDDVPAGEYTVDLKFKDGEPERRTVIEIVEEEVDPFASGIDVVRLNGRHVDPVAYRQAQSATGSTAPVVEWRYFTTRMLSTIKTAVKGKPDASGVFKTVWGGMYYDFRGIRKAKDVKGKEKATDEDLFFEQLGLGSIEGGLTAEKIFDSLRSDQRIAIFKSGVTGKPRRADLFRTPAGKESTGWGSITHDLRDEDIDIGTHPMMNLLKFQDAAREAIFEGPNGTPIFALFDGKGALQDEVPFNVAMDRTIPAPHTMRLQPAIGCIRCHAPSDMWQPLPNDAKASLLKRLDVVDDLNGRGKVDSDVIDRITGLYAGNFDKQIRRSRDDFAEAMLKVGGPWKESPDQTDAGRLLSSEIAAGYAEYNYQTVNAQRALRELGLVVPGTTDEDRKRAVELYKQIVPPDVRALVHGQVILEDIRIGALGRGQEVGRNDWSLVYAFAAERSLPNVERYIREKGIKP